MNRVDSRSLPESHCLRVEARRYFFPEDSEEGAALCKRLEGIRVRAQMMERTFGECAYDRAIDQQLEKRGFELFDGVRGIYQSEQGDWLIKRYRSGRTGLAKVGVFKNYDLKDVVFAHHYNNAYRVIMQRKAAAAVAKLGLQIIVPEEYLIPLQCDVEVPPYARYLVASRKIKLLDQIDVLETLNSLSGKQQRAVARQICRLIKAVGLIDANWRNFLLTGRTVQYEGVDVPELALVDTEPFAVLTDIEDQPPRCINVYKKPDAPEGNGRFSVRKARLYGLREFALSCKKRNLKEMASIAKQYFRYLKSHC